MTQIYSNYKVPHFPPKVVFECYFLGYFKVGIEARKFRQHQNFYYSHVLKIWFIAIEATVYIRKDKRF